MVATTSLARNSRDTNGANDPASLSPAMYTRAGSARVGMGPESTTVVSGGSEGGVAVVVVTPALAGTLSAVVSSVDAADATFVCVESPPTNAFASAMNETAAASATIATTTRRRR
ncbi:unannotated protein [freshwater metagenome]|uniref:Unannotated protein n=1 Tax=freshwater metagenome TaxID=449393 RepID=A0A6J6XBV5_9ZZZZ